MTPEIVSEEALPRNHGAKSERIDLGLALLSTGTPRGVTRSPAEIAAWCDCTPSMISHIEARALRRLLKNARARFHISSSKPEELRRWMEQHLCP